MSNVENKETTVEDLIVVGSSAGGVEALSTLVSTLPANFPAPIVLAQHLDPSRPSALDRILRGRTSLPVEVVTSSTRLRNGRIYVIPSNHHVVIKDHCVELQEDREKRPRPSVDTLLSTAAQAYGEHLIAVILTGSGSDGAVGAVDVKNAGGMVIVQDPHTARYPSMPLALPPSIVDFEVQLDQLGSLLYDLVTGIRVPQTEEKTEDVLKEILELVNRQANIDFQPYKASTILRRIGRRMTVTHCRTMRDYVIYLRSYPQEIGELVNAFLINVTQFFRDAEAFAYLKSDILPILIENARDRGRVLRFWTAGCATGEEPYSLAMLITDLLGAELPEWSIKIFATDLDESAISFARRGLYSESLLKGLPTDFRDRFFERVDYGYCISKTLRQMVIFGQQDLSRSAPFPRIDLVLCRNVLIYFTPELQDYVLTQFAFSLSPNGYLLLGRAETIRPSQTHYEQVNKQWKVYRCISNALPSVRRQGVPDIHAPHSEGHHMHHPSRTAGKQHVDQKPASSSLEVGQLRRLNEMLLRFLPIGVVIINRNYHILTANSTARRLLDLRDIAAEQDFLHAVHGIPYYETRNAIDTVFREHHAATLPEVGLDVSAGGNGRYVSLSISLMQLEPGVPDLAVISITNVAEQVLARQRLESTQAEQSQLANELGVANKRLSDANKELMDANEELQVANEELVLTHEELQASIEEFETTNEELQATNEEMETNNEELQATNEEMETTNDELRARTTELQELTTALESERVRLAEMVELAPFYILVLRGSNLMIEAYNPHYLRLLEGRTIQGHPLDEVLEIFWANGAGINILKIAREVYRTEATRTISRLPTYLPQTAGNEEVPAISYFTYTIVPSHDANGRVSGAIIYALDDTEQRAREAEEERAQLKLIFEKATTVFLALYDAPSARLLMGSPRYLDMISTRFGIDPTSLVGHPWYELSLATSSNEQARQLWHSVLSNRASMRLPELVYKASPDATESVWDYSLTPIVDTENPDQVRFMLVSAVEVTNQVQARKELEALDALKDDFLSIATHELRSPLTSILANAQLLQQRLLQHEILPGKQAQEQHDGQEARIIERMVRQVKQMNRLIDEMLDVALIRSNMFAFHNREGVDIVALARGVVEQETASEHPIMLNTSEENMLVTCDEDRIEQVLLNLLSNARKYSPQGRPITVTIEKRSEEPGEAVISVRDEGPGISQEEQTHIFDRFYRAQNYTHDQVRGLGLGLYIAHEIVIQQGGKMWLESEPGHGSIFYFSLPLRQQA